jgi:hypothetical protein
LAWFFPRNRDPAPPPAHYRKAAASPDPEIRRAAAEGLKNIGLQ